MESVTPMIKKTTTQKCVKKHWKDKMVTYESSSTMDKLVMQIDNMGDLDLVDNQFLLGKGE